MATLLLQVHNNNNNNNNNNNLHQYLRACNQAAACKIRSLSKISI